MSDIKNLSRAEKYKFWSDRVSLYYQSGLSQKEFCRVHNISYWSFNTWKRRLDKNVEKNQIQEISPELVKKLSNSRSNLEIILNETLRVSVPDNFTEETLRRIIYLLGIQL